MTMDRNLKRRSEFSSALATTNKTFDLKRKKILSNALDATKSIVDDSMEHSLPQRLGAGNRTKRVGFPSTKTFSHSNIPSVQTRQAAMQENLGHEVTPPRTDLHLNEHTRMEARESTEEMLDTTSDGKNVNVKCRRGLTKGLNTQKHTKMTGEKPRIIIPEEINRPIGNHSSKHASMIGVLIKLEAPMQVEGWGKILEDKKEELFLKLTARMKELRQQQQELPDDTSRMIAEQICVAILGENSAYAKSKGLKAKRLGGNIASRFEAYNNRIQMEEELATTKTELVATQTELANTKVKLATQ